ncbi:Cupin domain protein [Collimonas sp. OK607]|nr:Cupin domain protein [Collimonas sp. OK607]
MSAIRQALVLAASLLAVQFGADVYAQDSTTRTELKRTDLTGAPGMEVISSIIEIKPGAESARHSHHGVESGYVLQGAMIQSPGKEPVMLETGTPIMNLRDVPHGGFKVVGNKSLKLFTVHVVDKDKPLYEYVK